MAWSVWTWHGLCGHVPCRFGSNRPPDFKCLSCTWGDPYDIHAVLVEGRRIQVRRNLFRFLEHSIGSDERFWIDAMCINQEDVVERGHQVQRMGLIYGTAAEVVVWLGDQLQVDVVAPLLMDSDSIVWFDRGHCIDPMQVNPRARTGLEDICRHPYWSRVWIVQEVILQHNVWLLIGRMRISWRAFGLALAARRMYDWVQGSLALSLFDAWVDHHRFELRIETTDSLNPDSSSFQTIIRLGTEPPKVWLEVKSAPLRRFWDLFKRHSASQCTDLRDRVYSLLALVGPIARTGTLLVDYTETAAGLFWRAGEHFQAWHRLDCVELLLQALDISEVDLIASSKTSPDLGIIVTITNAFSEAAVKGSAVRTIGCWTSRCQCLSGFQCDSRETLFLCTKDISWTMTPTNDVASVALGPDFGPDIHPLACIHFLIQHVDNIGGASYELSVMLLQGLLPVAPLRALHVGHIEFNNTIMSDAAKTQDLSWPGMETTYVEKLKDAIIGASIYLPASLILEYYQHYLFERYVVKEGPNFQSEYGSMFDINKEYGRFR